ncbi:uncharacterized protein LOC108678946 isoform X3 [Hyalella azteca]|uniref:Uncharacterized protein LOC108678946 isoform X3 n=1 Tax=Hyalella azteca TaxID=294128 RepID=A0A8B7PA41_HYAAZ|nr:uncharacterized protein LOC108678946 isoform X3 [Hyalella azteca]
MSSAYTVVLAAVVALSLLCHNASGDNVAPRGLLTADMFLNAKASAQAVPAPVQDYSKVAVSGATTVGPNAPTSDPTTTSATDVKTKPTKKYFNKITTKKNHYPIFYYKSFYDPDRSGLPDQMMTASNNVNSVYNKNQVTNKNNASYNSALFTTNQISNSNAAQGALGTYGSLNSLQNSAISSSLLKNIPATAFAATSGDVASMYNLQQPNQAMDSNSLAAALARHQHQKLQLQLQEQQKKQQQQNSVTNSITNGIQNKHQDLQQHQQQQLNLLQYQQQQMAALAQQQATSAPSLFGTVMSPFKNMGKTFIDALEPLMSSDSFRNEQFAIPSQFLTPSEKSFNFGGDKSGGYPAVQPPTSYGAPVTIPTNTYGLPGPAPGPVRPPTNTYGLPGPAPPTSYGVPGPSPTSYGVPGPTVGGYGAVGGKGKTAINSDSLPFFAAASALAALGAFSVACAAVGANVTIGKRSVEGDDWHLASEAMEALQLYEPTITRGFETWHRVLQTPCVERAVCEVLRVTTDEDTIMSWQLTAETALEKFARDGDVGKDVSATLGSAGSNACHKLPCLGAYVGGPQQEKSRAHEKEDQKTWEISEDQLQEKPRPYEKIKQNAEKNTEEMSLETELMEVL